MRRERFDAREGESEHDQIDHDDRRYAAEHVGVHNRDHPNRPERAAGELANDCDEERPDQDEDFGDEEEPHVPQEPAEERDTVLPDQVPLEQHGTNACVVTRQEEGTRGNDGGNQPEPKHPEEVVAAVLRRGASVEDPALIGESAGADAALDRSRAVRGNDQYRNAERELDAERDLRSGISDPQRFMKGSQTGPGDRGQDDGREFGKERPREAGLESRHHPALRPGRCDRIRRPALTSG